MSRVETCVWRGGLRVFSSKEAGGASDVLLASSISTAKEAISTSVKVIYNIIDKPFHVRVYSDPYSDKKEWLESTAFSFNDYESGSTRYIIGQKFRITEKLLL